MVPTERGANSSRNRLKLVVATCWGAPGQSQSPGFKAGRAGGLPGELGGEGGDDGGKEYPVIESDGTQLHDAATVDGTLDVSTSLLSVSFSLFGDQGTS